MPEGSKETVLLIVDDEVATGKALSNAYKDSIEVITCSSHNEASEALSKHDCDVIIREVEELIIRKALEKGRGNKGRAAKVLGISLRTLRRRCNTIAKI